MKQRRGRGGLWVAIASVEAGNTLLCLAYLTLGRWRGSSYKHKI